MAEKLEQIKKKPWMHWKASVDLDALEKWQVKYLGRNSAIMDVFKGLGTLSKEEKPLVGKSCQSGQGCPGNCLDSKKKHCLNSSASIRPWNREVIDVTLPGRRAISGSLHPTTQTLREIYRVFGDMGFQIYRSREVETDQI